MSQTTLENRVAAPGLVSRFACAERWLHVLKQPFLWRMML